MAGTFFDQLAESTYGASIGSYSPEVLQGSMSNPLQALRLLSIDSEQEMSFDSEELAKVTGVPAAWFESEKLTAPIDEVIPALGRMALIYLSSLRNSALKYSFEVDAREVSLDAVETLSAVLNMNKRLKGC